MDGFSIWLVGVIFMSWLSFKPVTSPPAPHKETFILLPDAEGKTTGIVIKSAGQEAVVTEPFHGVELSGDKLASKTLSGDEVQKLYPDMMQALPEKPRSFTLRFEGNGTKLSAESLVLLGDIQQEIAKRAAPEITVIGYTDRAGSSEENLQLSYGRAASVRDMLVAAGISARAIQVVGRGETMPAVETEDGVVEPLNRRVEITVR